ncbi:ABC transporter permease [Clostridium oceanicum]|uniref:ABC transporter permease n=2 Tax=Clostridium oceanicum TaxID=1543 RepID=A0ABP3UKW0_9CLOT
MVEMFNLLKVEFHKLKTYKIFYFLILLTILQAVSMVTLSDLFRRECGQDVLVRTLLAQQGLSIIIFSGIFIGDYIVREFTSGYIKNLIIYGHKRAHIVISKFITCSLGLVIIGFTCPIIVCVRNTFINGYGTEFNLVSFLFLIRLFILMFFVYSVLAAIAVLIAFLFRNSESFVISMVFVLDFINRIINFFSIRNRSMLVSKIYSKSISSKMFEALKNKVPLTDLVSIIFYCLVIIIIFMSLSIYVFKRADIK